MNSRPDLIYYPDTEPGIRRERRGRGFSYTAPDGTRIDRLAERKRIAALGIPPAYEDVWICPKPMGYLQATGRDARSRKQYRYHPDWTAYRAARKFDHLANFGDALPRIRRAILQDLKGEPGTRDFAIAAILALLDRASMRLGHPEYTRQNSSYGATTLTAGHVTLDGSEIRLDYRAKGGQRVRKALRDGTLNKTLSRLDDLPGKSLVSWIDSSGCAQRVTSEAVNMRLQELTDLEEVTAKTFRTWNGSTAAMQVARAEGALSIKAMATAAAERLHNTASVARYSYIHPDVIALSGTAAEDRQALFDAARPRTGLRQAESALLVLLKDGRIPRQKSQKR